MDELKDATIHSDDAVRRAIVCAREDITALYVFASSANRQLASIRIALWLILAVLVYIAFILRGQA